LTGSRSAEPPKADANSSGLRNQLTGNRAITGRASLLIEQGVHIRVVQEVLGHTKVTTTERYTHVATLQMKGASERIDQAPWGEG
jgi:site-specific recombinase XerD